MTIRKLRLEPGQGSLSNVSMKRQHQRRGPKVGKITVINIQVTERGGIFHASSPDLPGLHVCGKRQASVLADVPEVITKLFKLNNGITVTVQPSVTKSFKVASAPTSFLASKTEALHA